MTHTEKLSRIFAENAGFVVGEICGKPEVFIPSSDPDKGILENLARFYELVKEQTLAELSGLDDPLLRPDPQLTFEDDE